MSTTGHLLAELDVMDVRRIQDPHGSHVEPELDSDWNDETKLRWHAGVTAVDAGLDIKLYRGGLWRNGKPVPNVWAVSVGRHSYSAMDYRSLWTFLNGVITGAQASRQELT
jgi:hypothetical protein